MLAPNFTALAAAPSAAAPLKLFIVIIPVKIVMSAVSVKRTAFFSDSAAEEKRRFGLIAAVKESAMKTLRKGIISLFDTKAISSQTPSAEA